MKLSAMFRMPAMRAAAGVLAVAVVVFGWTVVGAMRSDPLPPVASMAVASLDAITRRSAPPPVDLNAAVENDLFSPDRSPPSGSYRLPAETGPTEASVVIETPRPSVLGTAVATDGRSFATVQLGDSSPKLVHVGDRVGDWVVRAIARGRVTVVSASGVRADLGVTKTAANGQPDAGTMDAVDDPVPNAAARLKARRRGQP